jgi:potassium-transporting ATPase potassium-binding subunit
VTVTGLIQIIVLVAALTLLTPRLGGYMAKVYRRGYVGVAYLLGPVERLLYRAARADAKGEQKWVQYARLLLLFSAASWVALYVILRTQRIQPFSPQGFVQSGPWDLSFNTASSFVSNTSWQYCARKTTLSDSGRVAGITVASFSSMATAIAVAAAVIRGVSRRSTDRLGNFST